MTQSAVRQGPEHRTKNEYDGQGRLLATTDAMGNISQYEYTGDKLTTETDPLGNQTVYEYFPFDYTGTDARPGDLKLVTIKNKNGDTLKSTSYTYDNNGNRLTETTSRTKSDNTTETLLTRYEYDAQNRLVKTTNPLNNYTTVEYNEIGKQKSTTDLLGHPTTYIYDKKGNLVQTTYPGDYFGASPAQSDTQVAFTRTVYDQNNRPLYTLDRHAALAPVDVSETASTTSDATGTGTHTTYDAAGRVIQTDRVKDLTLRKTLDADGFASMDVQQPGTIISSTSTTYNPNNGTVMYTTDARGIVTDYVYDDAGRRAEVHRVDDLGTLLVTAYEYDANDNQTKITDANNHVTRFEYDELNRRTITTFDDSTTQTTAYDALGRRGAETDQLNRTTQFHYDDLGRLNQVTDPDGRITKYKYDEVGNLMEQTDAKNHTTKFEYDPLGRRKSRTLPDGQPNHFSESFDYDAQNLTSHTDFEGKVTQFSYDLLNRLKTKTPDPGFAAPSIQFTYTPTGKRGTMTDASGTTHYSYDDNDRLKDKQTPQGTLSYTYDENGNVLTITRSDNPAGTALTNTYNQLNQLAKITDGHLPLGTRAATCNYDDVGNLKEVTLPNDVTTSYGYDALNHLLTMSVAAGNLADYTYGLNAAGHRTSVLEQFASHAKTRQVAYAYDNINRLTSESITADPDGVTGTVNYTYDDVGNRLSRTLNGASSGLSDKVASVPAYDYDGNDRFTPVLGAGYDKNGNTSFDPFLRSTAVQPSSTHKDQYDFENRLIRRTDGSQIVTIVYDGDGNRVQKTVSGTGDPATTYYLVDDVNPTGYPQVVEEWQSINGAPSTLERLYIYGHALLWQHRRSAGAMEQDFYGLDGHGNVRLLTGWSGAVTDSYSYDAFGVLLAPSTPGTKNRYLYCAEQFDPDLGEYYLRARYLNPNTGRFWTMDTEEGDQEDPLSLNKYLYCEADPIDFIDPSGYESEGMLAVMDMANSFFAAVSPGASKAKAAVVIPLKTRPSTQKVRQLVAAIYAESSSKDYSGGENAVEKLAIGATMVNQAFYAKLPPGSKPKQRNYNTSFGDGTVLAAIKKQIVAYEGPMWSQVATATDLRPDGTIDKTLISSARDHYNLSVDAANAVTTAPMGIKDFNGEAPIGFNRASNTPPNPDRQHKIGSAAVHTFYGFDKGREYQ